MKKLDMTKWQNPTRCQGLLFFAQALEEALCYETIDSYRAPSLSTHLCCHELRYLCSEYSQNHTHESSLNYCIEELKYKVESDAVLTGQQKKEIKIYIGRLTSQIKNKERVHVIACNIEQEICKTYWKELNKRIKEYVGKPAEKETIRKLALAFCSELDENNISGKYAYHMTKKFFFSPKVAPKKITDHKQISDFLKLFSMAPKDFTIVFKCSAELEIAPDIAKTFKISKQNGGSIKTTNRLKLNLLNQEDKRLTSYIVINEVRAKEPHTAISYARSVLSMLFGISSFHNHTELTRCSFRCLVIDENDKCICINSEQNAMKMGAMLKHTEREELLLNSNKLLLSGQYSSDLLMKFLRSFDLHQAAAVSLNEENQLLDIWSAIEGFLPQPLHGEHRIEIYLQYILPLLTVTYPFKIFESAYDDICAVSNTGKATLDAITDSENYNKAMFFLTTAEHKASRDAFISNLDNPLLAYRCASISNSYSTTGDIYKTYKKHCERLDWHIRRIYLVRNQIVHRARVLSFIKSLIEHLHSYFDTIIVSLIRLSLSNPKLSITQNLEKIIMLHSAHMNSLECKNTNITVSNASGFIFGHGNPFIVSH